MQDALREEEPYSLGMESLSASSMQDPSSSPLEKQQSSVSGNGGLDSGRALFSGAFSDVLF